MAVKYQCPKCDKRFVEWGAEKLGFRCPDCKDEELTRVGAGEESPRRPTLKRTAKVASKVSSVNADDINDRAEPGDDAVVDDDLDSLDSTDETIVDDEPLD